MTPAPTHHVWAFKRPGGLVTVHASVFTSDLEGWLTECNRPIPYNDYRWIWCEFRTLNPAMVSLCKRCWK